MSEFAVIIQPSLDLTEQGFERLLVAITDAADDIHDAVRDAITAQLPRDFPEDGFTVEIR